MNLAEFGTQVDRDKVFIHRANFIGGGGANALESLQHLVSTGWERLEVDITMTGLDSFEFCHPSQLGMSAAWSVGPELFRRLGGMGSDIIWMLDIKYTDTGVVPGSLARTIHEVLGEQVMFVSSRPAMLTQCHDLGAHTAQFFRSGVSSEIAFEPDFYIRKNSDSLREPLDKTLVYCSSLDTAAAFLERGAGLVMVEASLLR